MPNPVIHSLLRILAAAGLLVFISACTTLGPDFKKPEASWLNNWDQSLHKLVISEQDGHEQLSGTNFWRGLFSDEILNGLIVEARRNNPQLRIAALRIFESRALQGVASSSLYPQVQQATASAVYAGSKNHDNGDNSDITNIQTGINIGWELDFWGRFQRSIEQADAAFFATIENQHAVQVLITAQVTELYFSYRVTQARIRIARKNAEIQKRSYTIAKELFDSGNTSELDLQQAKTQYLSTLSAIPPLEQNLIQTRNALAVLLARPPGDLSIPDDEDYELPHANELKAAILPTQLLLRRPDIQASAWLVAVQSAQLGISEAEFYPHISLIGSLGWAGSSILTAGSSTLAAGSALQWNIFDYGRIQNDLRMQDARLQQLMEQYQSAVLLAASEVDNAAIRVVKTAEQLKLLEETVQTAERALEIANTSYHEGYADFQRVLDAQRSLFSQTDRLVSTRGNNISALIALYKGLGGGWKITPINKLLPSDTKNTMKQRVDWGELLDAPIPQTNQTIQ
jgi:NodT family efflux transporter outer membrane factor (OMF) lipoprotein